MHRLMVLIIGFNRDHNPLVYCLSAYDDHLWHFKLLCTFTSWKYFRLFFIAQASIKQVQKYSLCPYLRT